MAIGFQYDFEYLEYRIADPLLEYNIPVEIGNPVSGLQQSTAVFPEFGTTGFVVTFSDGTQYTGMRDNNWYAWFAEEFPLVGPIIGFELRVNENRVQYFNFI